MSKIKNLWQIKELRTKLLFTISMLLLFRVGCNLAVPFINSTALSVMFTSGNMLTYLNMMSGGALSQCAVFALGVTPYINASIIIQLLTVAIPKLENIKKDTNGQETIEKITRYVAVVLAAIMSIGYYFIIRNYGALHYTSGVSGIFTAIIIVAVFVAGSQMTLWLGNQIDAHGLGNGVSFIIFAGIVSRWSSVYSTVMNIAVKVQAGDWKYAGIGAALVVMFLLMVYFVVYVNGSERRINVNYASQIIGRKQHGGADSFIPLKLIMYGVMPIIFASTILSIPQTISMFVNSANHPGLYKALTGFNSTNWGYCILYPALIFLFNYFYISIQYDPIQMANNLRKNAGTIPGIRPGKPTSDFLQKAMNQLAGTGSLALVLIAMAPIIVGKVTGMSVQLGGTSLLIVVGVATELMTAIDSYVIVRHHKGFLGY